MGAETEPGRRNRVWSRSNVAPHVLRGRANDRPPTAMPISGFVCRNLRRHSFPYGGNTMRTTLGTVLFALLGTLCLATPGLSQEKFTFTTVDFPGFANYNAPLGINERGDLAGFYNDANGTIHGYLRIRDRFQSLDYPGSTGTYCAFVSEEGDVSGTYF